MWPKQKGLCYCYARPALSHSKLAVFHIAELLSGVECAELRTGTGLLGIVPPSSWSKVKFAVIYLYCEAHVLECPIPQGP